MDSDEVNSISDTTEARQVADIIRTTYYNILARTNLPEHKELFQLDSSGDSDIPVTMTIPAHVKNMEWIKYFNDDADSSTSDGYDYVTILPLQQFLDYTNSLDTNENNVDTYTLTDNGTTFTLKYRNDVQPCYCTVVSDDQVLFDSYDSDVDTTLQSSKTMCFGVVTPTFTMSDSFTPDLDENQFPLLLNEAKSVAFVELKQMPNQKAEQEARRQWSSVQKNKSKDRISYFDQLPNFGRR